MIFVFLFLTISCKFQNDRTSSIEIAKEFYKGLNQADFKLISNCIADSFAVNEKEWNLILKYSKNEYQNWFQWDSIFNPKYEIVEIEERNDSVFATISKDDCRIHLLHENPLVYKVHFDIVDNKLIAINTIKYLNADWTVWQNNRKKFIDWIVNSHPDYSDFMNVQNKEFGEKYLKAINLYLEREKHINAL